jgi:MSHA biogenesis protein MshO
MNRKRPYSSEAAGFTLIEMIMVIVVASILAVGITKFMGQSVQGYADAGHRQQLATIGWVVGERMSRALRSALPNSVRVDSAHKCIEFIPTDAGSYYLSAPVSSAGKNMNVVRVRNFTPGTSNRVAIYPNTSAGLYPPSSTGALSASTISSLTLLNGDKFKLSLASSQQFPADSPERRFYITGNPVTYCITGSTITRYENYGFSATIASALSNPEVIVNRVSSGYFDYVPASLVRNAVVTLNFTVQDATSNEKQVIDQEVQIRNVP